MSELENSVNEIRKPWIGSPYYETAENWTFLFWAQGSPFKRLFDTLPKGNVIELACGHGRHAQHAAELCDHLHLVDVIEDNLSVCRERLKDFSNISYSLGAGVDFPDTAMESVDAIYCYDAMVHFSPEIIEAYLGETKRVLKREGRALYHHSNYADGQNLSWGRNPHARNYMTRALFAEMAGRVGLTVIEQVMIDWGGVKELDCITLLGRT